MRTASQSQIRTWSYVLMLGITLILRCGIPAVSAQDYEADPSKNGAQEIMKKVLAALPANAQAGVVCIHFPELTCGPGIRADRQRFK
jgi:hypothetical protein